MSKDFFPEITDPEQRKVLVAAFLKNAGKNADPMYGFKQDLSPEEIARSGARSRGAAHSKTAPFYRLKDEQLETVQSLVAEQS
jgi:hypothetical protein